GFRVLGGRLVETLPNGIGAAAQQDATPDEPQEGFEITVALPGPDEVTGWLAEHAAGPQRSGLAMNGTWGRGTGTLTGIALAAPDGECAFFDPSDLGAADERALAGWLADPLIPKALHDAKGPMHALAAHGLQLHGLTSDTALAAYLALPGQRSFDLGDLVLRYLGRELRGEAAPGQLSLDGIGEERTEPSIAEATALRARATGELADALDADLEQRGAAKLLRELELPL